MAALMYGRAFSFLHDGRNPYDVTSVLVSDDNKDFQGLHRKAASPITDDAH
jgi:hypothetical protein